MKAFTDKKDFYRGRYNDYRFRSLCALEGCSEELTEFLYFVRTSDSRYSTCLAIALLLNLKDLFPYLSFIQYLADEDLLPYIKMVCKARNLRLSEVNERLIEDLPNSKKRIEEITGRSFEKGLNLNDSVYNFLSLPEEDRKLLAQSAFYDERSFICKIFCKRKGWTNTSLNKLEVLFNA